jgi:hypothetical protein
MSPLLLAVTVRSSWYHPDMAPLGRFLLGLGGGVFAFFLVAVLLTPTTGPLSGLREWWAAILFVFVVLIACGGVVLILARRKLLMRRFRDTSE